jgi:hypothetical protein
MSFFSKIVENNKGVAIGIGIAAVAGLVIGAKM